MKNKHEQIFDIVTDGTLNIGQIVNKLADREAVTERICNRRIGRSCLIMGIVFLALGFSGLWVRFHEHATPAQSLPDRPGIVLDTSLIDHSEIPDDTSYKSYRQGSPEADTPVPVKLLQGDKPQGYCQSSNRKFDKMLRKYLGIDTVPGIKGVGFPDSPPPDIWMHDDTVRGIRILKYVKTLYTTLPPQYEYQYDTMPIPGARTDRRYDSAVKTADPKIAVVQECHLTTFGYWALWTTGWNHGKVIYDGWIKGPTRAACERHRKEEYNKGYAVVYSNGIWLGLKYDTSVMERAERRAEK